MFRFFFVILCLSGAQRPVQEREKLQSFGTFKGYYVVLDHVAYVVLDHVHEHTYLIADGN